MAKKTTNILVLTYWDFNDALVQNYTLPYVKIISKYLATGSKIYLVTLDKKKIHFPDLSKWNISNVSIIYQSIGIKGIWMWISTIIKLLILIRKNKIEVIHTWCTPAGAMGYILSILTNKQLVLDSYEPHAESMVENGTWKKNGLPFKILFYLEKLQTHRAKHIISATKGMIDYAKERYNFYGNNFYVKPACVDLNFFTEKKVRNSILMDKYNLHNKIICIYAGKFGGIYLDNEVFELFKVAEKYFGDRFVALVLSSHSKEEIDQYKKRSNLKENTLLHLFVNHSDIPDYIGLGDFAITPVKPIPTKRYCTPIKDGEYWAMGLPIIITENISDDSEIIEKEKIGVILKNFNAEAYLIAIKEIEVILTSYSKEELQIKIRKIAIENRNFENADKIYKSIYSLSN